MIGFFIPKRFANCPLYWQNFEMTGGSFSDTLPKIKEYGGKFQDSVEQIWNKGQDPWEDCPAKGLFVEFETEAQMLYFIMEWS